MDSGTAAIRILVSSAFAALIVALVVILSRNPGTASNQTVMITRSVASPSAPTSPVSVAPTAITPPSQPTQETQLPQPSSPPRYSMLPVTEARPNRLVSHCFTSATELTVSASPREMAVVTAALNSDWKTVRRMLDAGASIESADDNGIRPLMAAAMKGDTSMIRSLLDKHASPNALDQEGNSALFYAVKAANLQAVQTLLSSNLNFENIAAQGGDLLTTALQTGDMTIFQTVLASLPATLKWTSDTRGALEAALRGGMKDQVRLLLNKHPDPPTREGGVVPLIAYAIALDDVELFRTLLACGSDPNIVIPRAAENDFIALLKSKYLRLYIQEETGINILMLAAGLGKTDYVRALLDAGADRHRATPRERMLPLYFAAWTGEWKAVQLLLGGGPLPEELRVEISLAKQNMSVIKDGVAVYRAKCSTGREGYKTPTGQFVITDKDRDHRSTIYKVPMPYFMRLNCRDFGMHEGAVPTYPASHGCIRLPSEAARKLFAEIPVGTVVTIN
jgi:ankyrin repeat protein